MIASFLCRGHKGKEQTGVIGCHLIYEIYTVVSIDVFTPEGGVLDCEHEST